MEKNTTLCGTKCDLLLVAYLYIPLPFYIHHFLSWTCVCRTHKYVGTCTHIRVNVNEWGSMVLILGVFSLLPLLSTSSGWKYQWNQNILRMTQWFQSASFGWGDLYCLPSLAYTLCSRNLNHCTISQTWLHF